MLASIIKRDARDIIARINVKIERASVRQSKHKYEKHRKRLRNNYLSFVRVSIDRNACSVCCNI